MCRWIAVIGLMLAGAAQAGPATVPTADKPGAKDHLLLKRYEGAFIVAHEHERFGELLLPLSALEKVPGRKIGARQVFEPKDKRTLEGERTRLVYLIPENRSPLEVLRNYEQEIESRDGIVLFRCAAESCGGDPDRSSERGATQTSLSSWLYPPERLKEERFSAGDCALSSRIADQRYAAAKLPSDNAYVSVLTYALKTTSNCKALDGRTVAVIDLLEEKPREQKMVTVQAEEMAQSIASTGSVALYGIYFDFNKADVKSESEPALQQIAKLLKDQPALKLLVVGHTDNVGSFDFNRELSQRRAAAVVTELAARHGIAKARLLPVGVSFAAPVAPNTSEEGRAKNRRVELVENTKQEGP